MDQEAVRFIGFDMDGVFHTDQRGVVPCIIAAVIYALVGHFVVVER